MAIHPDYVTGTLTLTANSAAFTTSGSALQAAAVQAGDEIITRSGNVLVIASITGQNAGTLMQPCPTAAAGSGQPLRIRFQPDGSRYQGAARDLIEKLASGNVETLASIDGAAKTLPYFTGAGTMDAVVGAADTMPYFTGVNGMGNTPLTAFARTLLDDAGQSTALATLTNGSRLSALLASNITDCNNITETGIYFILDTAANLPTADHCYLTHFSYSVTNAHKQIAYQASGRMAWERYKWFGNWQAWQPISIQYGSNSSGNFIRYPDGTQICTRVNSGTADINTAWNGLYRSGVVQSNHAAEFLSGSVPTIMACMKEDAGNAFVAFTNATATTARVFLARGAAATAVAFSYQIIAVGRWF